MTPSVLIRTTMLLAGILTPSLATGQGVFPTSNGKALRGVRAFDANVLILTWLGMDLDEGNYESNIQAAFELGLRRDGVVVEYAAPNYLLCELKFAGSGGLVAYSYDVTYYSYETKGIHRLLWDTGGMVIIGQANLDPGEVAQNCVDSFVNEWLKWNPRQ